MANNTINFKGTFDVGNVLQGIDKIKKDLSTLSLGPKTQAEFDTLFQKIERNTEKASKAMASGFKNRGEVKQYEDAIHQIATGYDDVITKLKVLSGTKKIHLNIDDTAIKTVIGEIETLTKKWKQAQTDLTSTKKSSYRAMEKAANKYEGGATAWNDAVTAFKNGDIAGAEQAIKRLESALKAAKTRAGQNPLSDEWKEKAKDIKTVRDALDDYKKAQGDVVVSESELTSKQQEFNNLTEKGTKILVEAADAGEKEAKSIRESGKASVEAAKSTQQFNAQLDQFKNKAAYFFGITNAINLLKRSIRSAYNTVKDLDAVMTETAVVTNFSVGDMWTKLPEYTQRANELGVTIHDTYEAATLFYQQGLKTNEVMAISNETLKMARIAGLDAATASDRMTNALRGFNMELDKTSAQRVNDVYSKLAAITASNTDEISTAMTKVASLAHNANMEFETTAAFLAQIIESTRESAETAGTALKTVVARFSEVKKLYSKGELLGEDEEGEQIDVNKVSTALRSAGINLNEYLTGAKGLDDIFIELAEKWDGLDQVQQRYIATMAAGSRQQSRFIALMSDYKRTMQLVDAANNANGASQEQYGKTLESLQTKLARLKNAWNEFILGLTNSDVIKGAVDALTKLITAINNVIKAISGKNAGVKMITTFFTAFTTFKIGSKITGNTVFGKLFKGLVTDANGQAVTGARTIAKTFYSNLATQLTSGSFRKSITNSALDFKNYFAPVTEEMTVSMTKILQENQPAMGLTDSQMEDILTKFQSGKYTIGEFNEVLRNNGVTWQFTEEEAAKMGIIMKDDNTVIRSSVTEMRTCATTALAMGGAFMAIGNILEQQDNEWSEFGTMLKYVGTGLMVFGTIMSVTLPLQAEIMAKGVSTAIYSIPIVGWLALIISLLAAVAIGVAKIVKNNSAEAKLEKAAEAAKAAAEAANEAKEAYEELSNTWDSLQDKYDAIEQVTEGTKEWRDAIRETNEAVLELANNYDNISISRDDNGLLSVDNWDEVKNEQLQKTLQAEGTATTSQIAKINAMQDVEYDNLKKAIFDKDTLDYFTGEALEELTQGMDAETIRNRVRDKFNYEIEDDEIVALQQYGKNYANNNAALESQRTVLGATMLENAQIDKDLQKYVNTAITDKYVKDIVDNNKETYVGYSKSDLRKKYADALGYKSFKELANDNPEAKNMSKEQLQNYLATKDALEQTNKQLNIFANNIHNLNDDEKALFEEQKGEALTLDQVEALRKYSENEKEQLYKDLGGDKVYGENGFTEFTKWFDETLSRAETNFDKNKYGEQFSYNLEEDYTAKLSSGTYAAFADNLWSTFITSGQEGVDKINDSIKKMTENMDSDDIEKFMKSINSVDWENIDSIKSLDKLAEEFNISEEAIKSFENQIIDLNKAISQVDFEQLSKVLGLAKNISSGEQGRAFTEEQYNTAIEGGANKKDFYYNAATGNYDYIGKDLQEVAKTLTKGAEQNASNTQKRYEGALAVGEYLKKNGDIDYNNKTDLTDFIGSYLAAAGKGSIIDEKAYSEANTIQLQAMYDKIMEDYANRADLKQNVDETRQLTYQFNSGAQNAADLINFGDEESKRALLDQIVNSGITEELTNQLIKAVNEVTSIDSPSNIYDTVIAGNIVDTMDKGKALGIDPQTLNEYVDALRTVEGLENAREDSLYALALANQQYQDGFKKIIDSYDEWIELEREGGGFAPEAGNLEQFEAFEDLKKNLKEMLNYSKEISNEFLSMPENAELLKKAVDGDTQAVAQLRANLAKEEFSIGFSLEDRDNIYNAIDQLTQDVPNIEFGASINENEYAQNLMDMLMAAGATAEQINSAFETIGYTPPITGYEEIPYEDLTKNVQKGSVQVVDPVTGAVRTVTTDNVSEFKDAGVIKVPIFGDSKFVKPTMPSTKPKSSSSGGGGGGSKKKTYWENPYDELYNLQEKINEALRTREALERRYQKLLKQEQATLADIRKSYYAQISNLHTEANLQKQFAAGRLRQINELGNKIYTDDEGNRKSFSSLGVTKYASYNAQTGLITIDWEGLDAISKDSSREKEGKAAEAYISKLEDLVSSYEEVRDKLWDIEDEIEKLREAAIESYLSFEDRVKEALVNSYQQQIDSYQSMSDALEKANSEVIDSLREQIDLSRQIRDNTEKEKEISDMENRLAYLQRDTSGANALEIQKLQKDLEDARQGYGDELIDQAIDKMQNDADLAAEQRARQIETMQEQLEIMKNTGALWQQVYDLMNEAAEGDGALSPKSNLVKLLQETEAFSSLSNIGQAKWWSEVAEEFHAAWVGLSEAEDKYKKDANNDGTIYDSKTQEIIEDVNKPVETPAPAPAPAATAQKSGYDDKTKYGVALAVCDGYWGNGDTRRSNLKSKGFDPDEIQRIVNKVYKDAMSGAWYGKYYGIKDTSQYKMSKFKTGGLADFTGPAWLDGTKTKPELILNAQDSANFIALKDILASLLNIQGGRGVSGNGGDNYFDIDISANLSSDYDVDRLTEKIKRDIYQDGQYRNVNTINFLR